MSELFILVMAIVGILTIGSKAHGYLKRRERNERIFLLGEEPHRHG